MNSIPNPNDPQLKDLIDRSGDIFKRTRSELNKTNRSFDRLEQLDASLNDVIEESQNIVARLQRHPEE